MKSIRLLLLSFAASFGCSYMVMPTDFASVSAGTRANLKANFSEAENKFNPCADSVAQVRARLSGYTSSLAITSLENLRLRLDGDGTATAKFLLETSNGDSLFRVSEDSTAKFFGNLTVAGTTTHTGGTTFSSLTASLPVFTDGSKALASNAMTGTGSVMMSASPTTTGTLTGAAANFSGAVSTGALSATTGSFSSTLGVTGASTLAGLSATTGSFSSTLAASGLLTASGGVLVNGGTDAAGRLFQASTHGITLRGATATTYDLSLLAANGAYLLRNPTSTSNLEFPTGTTSFTGPSAFASTVSRDGDDIFTATNHTYRANTSDGSDTKRVYLTGGGSATDTRGGYILVSGNENASQSGYVEIAAGNVSGGDIKLFTGGSLRYTIAQDGTQTAANKFIGSDTVVAANGLRSGTGTTATNLYRSGADMWTMPDSLSAAALRATDSVVGASARFSGGAKAANFTSTGGESFTYGDTSFTITVSAGMSTTPTGTAVGTKIGNMVVLRIPYISGTSNATTFTLSGIPSGWYPATAQVVQTGGATDNGTSLFTANARVMTDGTILLGTSTGGFAGWTSSGTKATSFSSLFLPTITYTLQ